MPVQLNNDDEPEVDPEPAAEPKARRGRMLATSQSTVEGALDNFIARAHEKPLDVATVAPFSREHALEQEIVSLKQQLATAEARVVETKTAWVPVIAAFLLGGAGMFAFHVVTGNSATSAPAPTAHASPPSMHETTMPPSTVAPPPMQAETQPAETPTPVATPARAPTPAPTPVATTTSPTPTPPKRRDRPATAPKPPFAPASGSDSGDLYNPF